MVNARFWADFMPGIWIVDPPPDQPPGQPGGGVGNGNGGGVGNGGPGGGRGGGKGRGGGWTGGGGWGRGGSGGGGGSSAAIETIDVSTMTAGGWEEIDVTGYTTLEISADNAKFSSNLADIEMQLSDDGGSTWYTTSGDYRVNEVEDNLQPTNDRTSFWLLDGKNATGYGDTHYWAAILDHLTLACPKKFSAYEFLADPGGGSDDGEFRSGYFKAAVTINRIRIRSISHNGVSGTIYIRKSARSQTLIEAWDASAGGNTKDFDLSGYSCASIISTGLNLTAGSELRARVKNGATVYSGATDYRRTVEIESFSSADSSTRAEVETLATGTTKRFTLELMNLSVAAPTGIDAVGLSTLSADDSRARWRAIVQATSGGEPVVVDGVRIFTPSANFASGTVYVIGDATPLSIIETIDMSTMGTSAVIDVTGKSRVLMASYDAFATPASEATWLELSSDSGSNYDTTSGDYWVKREHGSTELQEARAALEVGNESGAGATGARVGWADIRAVAAAMPAFASWQGTSIEWMGASIHRNPVAVNRARLKFEGGASGDSGKIYFTAEAA